MWTVDGWVGGSAVPTSYSEACLGTLDWTETETSASRGRDVPESVVRESWLVPGCPFPGRRRVCLGLPHRLVPRKIVVGALLLQSPL